jgi:hypothetical protein
LPRLVFTIHFVDGTGRRTRVEVVAAVDFREADSCRSHFTIVPIDIRHYSAKAHGDSQNKKTPLNLPIQQGFRSLFPLLSQSGANKNPSASVTEGLSQPSNHHRQPLPRSTSISKS